MGAYPQIFRLRAKIYLLLVFLAIFTRGVDFGAKYPEGGPFLQLIGDGGP